MDNNKFWEQYKEKCLEKGLPILHENEEDFSKAMSEPPKPFSTDDITSLSTREHIDFSKRDRLLDGILEIDDEDIGEVEEDTMPKHVKWERCKECGEMKEDSDFGHNRDGSLKKICKACHGRKISEARKGNAQKPQVEQKETSDTTVAKPLHAKEVPLLKEPKEKMVSMSEAVFHEIIIMAYERGVMQAQTHLDTLIVEADLPVILDDILGENHVQSVA